MAHTELDTDPPVGQTGVADGRMLRLPPATIRTLPLCRRLPQGGVFICSDVAQNDANPLLLY